MVGRCAAGGSIPSAERKRAAGRGLWRRVLGLSSMEQSFGAGVLAPLLFEIVDRIFVR